VLLDLPSVGCWILLLFETSNHSSSGLLTQPTRKGAAPAAPSPDGVLSVSDNHNKSTFDSANTPHTTLDPSPPPNPQTRSASAPQTGPPFQMSYEQYSVQSLNNAFLPIGLELSFSISILSKDMSRLLALFVLVGLSFAANGMGYAFGWW
jgi:hypothetical protein